MAAQDFIRRFASPTEVLLLCASRDALDDFARELSATEKATFGLHRFSFIHFAARTAIGSLARERLAPASLLGGEATAARSSFEVAKRGALTYFLPVAMRPGFARALAATIAELRAAGVDPDALARLGNAASDVAELMQEFGEQLRNSHVIDRSQLFQIAVQAVNDVDHNDVDDLIGNLIAKPLLLLDVPLHTEAEGAFASVLISRASQAFVTVPAGDERTLDCLSRLGDSKLVTTESRNVHSVARLQNSIFTHETREAKPDDHVKFFSAPGEARECIEVARFILEEARSGTPFDRIAVLTRQPRKYSELLEAALNRAGIPSYFARGTARPDPGGRAFLAILSCATEGLSAQKFAEYLSFGQIPELKETGAPPDGREIWSPSEDEAVGTGMIPDVQITEPIEQELVDSDQQPTILGALRAPRKWEQLLVEAAVVGGKDRWERRLNGLAAELRLRLEELRKEEPESPRIVSIERDLNNLAHLKRFSLPLIDFLAAFPESATWGDWLTSLEKLATMVLRQPERVLSIITELKPLGAVGPVSLGEVREVLSDRLSTLEIEPPKSRYGRVFVGIPEHARGRSFDVVFIPGMVERSFPERLREDPVLLDDLRVKLKGRLTTQEDRVSKERLLLRLAIGAATRQLYLSYPRIEVGLGRPRVPSFYALDVQRAVTGRVPEIAPWEREAARLSDASLDWPAPRNPERAIDDLEHDLSKLRQLLHSDPATVTGRANYLFALNSALGRSLRARWARWRQKKWSAYDGVCSQSEKMRDLLSQYSLRSRSYSPTSLQHFAVCPYRFFLASIYRLSPRESATQIERLDPLTKGAMFHSIQAETLRELLRQRLLPLNQSKLGHAGIVLDEVVDRVAEESRETLFPAIDRVWRDEIEHLRADLRGWLRRAAEAQEQWVPLLIEFGFGVPLNSSHDPQSIQEPAMLGEEFKLHGVIDLVERNNAFLRVTDTKTGIRSASDGFVTGGGEKLQPVLYSLAIEAIRKTLVAEGRLSFPTSAGGFSQVTIPINEDTRKQGHEVLRIIDNAVTAGLLPPAPREEACRYCDFRAPCGPYEEKRVQKKDQTALADLIRLRGLP